MLTLCALLLTLISCCSGAFPGPPKQQINSRPIIGILTQEIEDDNLKPFGKTYIPSSYVKYLESAGCRVTPVKLNLTLPEYEKIFNSINGMMFIGGAVNLRTSDFAKAAAVFYKLALKAYISGDYFPLWGTCLGFQLLTALVSGDDLLTNATVENKALPLNLTADAESSRMFRNFPPELMKSLAQEPLTGNFHHYGIATQTFEGNERLESFFSILSTNKAKEGVEFVSTIEGKEYPFYGVQWHPEVSRFQWHPDLEFPHSVNAVRVSYLTADFFVNEARRSSHHFSSAEEEDAALIYNYSPLYVGNISGYMQIYFF
ncbi:gamma-glutamyl hydrolase isoform X1 [Polyodon spathula]|uniref:gamma-glutamyl hydrolase isoform X1 n=1 Tax=Polyodon spathula TaxID=7913 RepID=UPI001B7E61E8|nr:gamma-glutamyl hydrolase isoform X1 [Polyodon spathula]